MRRLVVLIVAVVAALALAGCGGGGLGSDMAVTVADEDGREPAPELSVPALDGSGPVTLAGRDKPVVLNFWASWCEPCTREMPALVEFHNLHPEVDVIGVAVNDLPEDSRAFAEDIGIPFTLASDRGGDAAADFGVQGLPVTVLIDAEGRLAATHPGEIDRADLEAYAAGLAP